MPWGVHLDESCDIVDGRLPRLDQLRQIAALQTLRLALVELQLQCPDGVGLSRDAEDASRLEARLLLQVVHPALKHGQVERLR